jgi:DNA-binding transcriptional regulator YdaS (Cro superfamily)
MSNNLHEVSINNYLLSEESFVDIVSALRIISKYKPSKDGDSVSTRKNWDNPIVIQSDILALAALNSKIAALVGLIKASMESFAYDLKRVKAARCSAIREDSIGNGSSVRVSDKTIADKVCITMEDIETEYCKKIAKYEVVLNCHKSISEMVNALKLQLRVIEDEKKLGL